MKLYGANKVYLMAAIGFLIGMAVANAMQMRDLNKRLSELQTKVMSHEAVVSTFERLSQYNFGGDATRR